MTTGKFSIYIYAAIASFMVVNTAYAQRVLFVDVDAAGGGDGLSWPTAYKDLQDALDAAIADDQIWVAEGTYYPDRNTGLRDSTFTLINNVSIYGGFTGTEDELNQRDWKQAECILSGDLQQNDLNTFDSNEENAFTVVTAGNTTNATARLDGFAVAGGNSDQRQDNAKGRGGGIYLTNATPTLRNLLITGNSAESGGGLANRFSDPVIEDCIFQNNRTMGLEDWHAAEAAGGAIFNFRSEPTLNSCQFLNNNALSTGITSIGGAISNIYGGLHIFDCYFEGNQAGGDNYRPGVSGAISLKWIDNEAVITIQSSEFVSNAAVNGPVGAIRCDIVPLLEVTDCLFDSNTSRTSTGAISLYQSNAVINQCSFLQNTSTEGKAGAIQNFESSASLSQCTFTNNHSEDSGGAIYCEDSSLGMTDCVFTANNCGIGDSSASGGGVFNENSDLIVIGCDFINNTSDMYGGGMFCTSQGNVMLSLSTFVGNSTSHHGGGLRVAQLESCSISECLFEDNTAVKFGGGLAFETNGDITKCTFRNNHSGEEGGGLWVNSIANIADLLSIKTCGFLNNICEGKGGGLLIQGKAILEQCSFQTNTSQYGGGVSCNANNEQYFVECTFKDNTAVHMGGGLSITGRMDFINCKIIGNEAMLVGGGIYCNQAEPRFANSLILGNRAIENGGGVFNRFARGALLRGCVVLANEADLVGGGVYYYGDGEPFLNNNIFYLNSDSNGNDLTAQIYHQDLNEVTVNYSCIQAWDGSFNGVGNIGDDPMFVDALGIDGIPGTEDDDLHLSRGSPCIDAADNDAVSIDVLDFDNDGDVDEPIPFDLDNLPRFFNDLCKYDTGNGIAPVVDMGAFEFQDLSECLTSITDFNIVTGTLMYGELIDILESDDSHVNVRSSFGETFIDLHNMEMLVSAITNIETPVSINLLTESHLDHPAGIAQIRFRNWNTNQFESVGSYAIGNTDNVNTIDNIDATNYVNTAGMGEIEMSLKHIVFVPFLAFTFESFIDQIDISVNQ